MKILTRPQIKKVQQDSLERGRVIDQYVAQKTKDLNSFKLQYESKKREIFEDFIKFAEYIINEKRRIESADVGDETRPSRAYASLAKISLEAEERLKKSIGKEAKIETRVAEIERREQLISKRTETLDERENMLNSRARELSDQAEKNRKLIATNGVKK